jgi:hypothetical protein
MARYQRWIILLWINFEISSARVLPFIIRVHSSFLRTWGHCHGLTSVENTCPTIQIQGATPRNEGGGEDKIPTIEKENRHTWGELRVSHRISRRIGHGGSVSVWHGYGYTRGITGTGAAWKGTDAKKIEKLKNCAVLERPTWGYLSFSCCPKNEAQSPRTVGSWNCRCVEGFADQSIIIHNPEQGPMGQGHQWDHSALCAI